MSLSPTATKPVIIMGHKRRLCVYALTRYIYILVYRSVCLLARWAPLMESPDVCMSLYTRSRLELFKRSRVTVRSEGKWGKWRQEMSDDDDFCFCFADGFLLLMFGILRTFNFCPSVLIFHTETLKLEEL